MADTTNSLVAGLFGLTPQQAWQQQYQKQDAIAQQAFNNAAGTPGQLMAQAYANMGTGAVGLGTGLMGIEPASVVAARNQEAMLQGVDMSDPESIRQRALQIQDPKMKAQLSLLANSIEAEQVKAALEKSQILANIHKANSEASPLAKIDVSKFTPESIKKYVDGGMKDPSVLVVAENPNMEVVEAGVQGKPAWRQKVLIDKKNPNAPAIPVSAPYEIPAGIRLSMGGAAGGGAPPKNLTREARLKWELENGMIDQQTYDSSMAATPGAKLRAEKLAAANLAELGFKAVEDNINKLYDERTGKLKSAAEPLFGKYNQFRPVIAMKQDTVDANAALESLTNQVMMANLADAKERVGQSFGSMQVQEWDKFTQQLTSLRRGLSPSAAASAMRYVKNFIKTKRNILSAAMGESSKTAPVMQNKGSVEFLGIE
jgi:hypothetical protein